MDWRWRLCLLDLEFISCKYLGHLRLLERVGLFCCPLLLFEANLNFISAIIAVQFYFNIVEPNRCSLMLSCNVLNSYFCLTCEWTPFLWCYTGQLTLPPYAGSSSFRFQTNTWFPLHWFFLGVLQEHILSQFLFFLCVFRTLLERRPGYRLYEQPPHPGIQVPPLL